MNRSSALPYTFLAALFGACTFNHALGVSSGGDGGPNTSGPPSADTITWSSPTSDSDVPPSSSGACGLCSVACAPFAAVQAQDIETDGKSIFVATSSTTGGDTDIVRYDSDGTSAPIVTNYEVNIPFAVGPTTVGFIAGGGGPAPIYVVPSDNTATSIAEPVAVAVSIEYGGLALDAANAYYVASGTTKLYSVPLSGPGGSKEIADVGSKLDQMVFGVDSSSVYYYVSVDDTSYRQPLGGGSRKTLASDVAGGIGGGINDSDSFFSYDQGGLSAVPKDGSAPHTLVTWSGNSFAQGGYSTDGTRVYYVDPACNAQGDCAIRSVPVHGGAITTLCTSVPISGFAYLNATADALYMSVGAEIYKLAKQ